MGELRVERLTKAFDVNAGAVVNDVSFSASGGEIISLLGPSGCGKTTTLRCIAGLEHPEQGEIWLDGQKITTGPRHLIPPERRGMGMVFQSYSIWPHMTVGENIAIGLRAKGMNRTDAGKKVDEVLSLVRLPGLADRRATDLSGGQQQRVALARSLALEPKVLLFDEPLSNLDANLREEMRFEIRELLHRFAITSVYVTHDQVEAFVISDRICVMQLGRIVQAGTPEEIYCRPSTRFISEFIGSANVLSGTVRGLEEGRPLVALADGQRLQATGTAPVGQRVDLCIRPEAIDLLPEGIDGPPPANSLAGRISARAYLGNAFDYRVAVGPDSLRVAARPTVRIEVGQTVWVQVGPEGVLVLGPSAATS